MADEPKGGSPEVKEGAEAGVAPVPEPVATESPEELRARIAKLESEKGQWTAEQRNRANEQQRLREVEAENERLRRSTVPPATANADPLAQRIGELEAMVQAAPHDAAAKWALEQAQAQQQQRAREALIESYRGQFQAMPAEIGEIAWGLFTRGEATTPMAAQLAAEGLLAKKKGAEGTAAEAKRRAEDEELAKRAKEKPSTSTVGVTAAGAKVRATITFAEWEKRLAEGDRKLIAQVDAGEVHIE